MAEQHPFKWRYFQAEIISAGNKGVVFRVLGEQAGTLAYLIRHFPVGIDDCIPHASMEHVEVALAVTLELLYLRKQFRMRISIIKAKT